MTSLRSHRSRITAEDMRHIAITLVERHGEKALDYADMAVGEMEELKDDYRANAWRALRSEIEDVLDGRADALSHITLH